MKRSKNKYPSSPFMGTDTLQNTSSMRLLIRLLAAQAVKS